MFLCQRKHMLCSDQWLLFLLLGCLEIHLSLPKPFKNIHQHIRCQKAIFHQLCFLHFVLKLVFNSIPSSINEVLKSLTVGFGKPAAPKLLAAYDNLQ